MTTQSKRIGERAGRCEANVRHPKSHYSGHNAVFLRPAEWFVDEQYVFTYCNGSK
jgi:hypothetical protein